MPKRSNKSTDKKRLDPMIVVAIIGLAGTIIAALLASPLLERLFITLPSPVPTPLESSNATSVPQTSQTAPPAEALNTTTGTLTAQATTPVQAVITVAGTQIITKPINLNQTVTGTLYGAEAGVWVFSEGPATITVILDVGPFGGALIIVKDPSGVDRAYRDQQTRPGVTQLVNFFIPTDGDYTIWVRNTVNEQADYTLTVQNALTPPPP
jgi:hypothetical protein